MVVLTLMMMVLILVLDHLENVVKVLMTKGKMMTMMMDHIDVSHSLPLAKSLLYSHRTSIKQTAVEIESSGSSQHW